MAQQGIQMQPMNTLESIQSRLNTLNARATAAGQIVGNAGRFPELVQNLERITAALKTKVSEVSRTLAGINIPEGVRNLP